MTLSNPLLTFAVRHLGSLEAFVSCSTRPQSSMVIGWREKDSRSLRVTSFFTKQGVWDMDHHQELNLIGKDKYVLWARSHKTFLKIYELNASVYLFLINFQ